MAILERHTCSLSFLEPLSRRHPTLPHFVDNLLLRAQQSDSPSAVSRVEAC